MGKGWCLPTGGLPGQAMGRTQGITRRSSAPLALRTERTMDASELGLLGAVRQALNEAESSSGLIPGVGVEASTTHLLWAAQLLDVLIRRRTG